MPDISLGTDVIVGFPGETDADFEDTLTLLDAVQFDTVYSFAYSPRPSTAALNFDEGVDPAVRGERLRTLQARQKTIQERRNETWVGHEVEILVEGPSSREPANWTGRTPEHRVVNFPGPGNPGKMETVRITRSTAFSLWGEAPATLA